MDYPRQGLEIVFDPLPGEALSRLVWRTSSMRTWPLLVSATGIRSDFSSKVPVESGWAV